MKRHSVVLLCGIVLGIAGGCGGDKSDPLDPGKAKPVLTSIRVEPAEARVKSFGPSDIRLRATGLDQDGQDMGEFPFSWTSSDTSILTLTPSGQLIGRANGAAKVTANYKGISGESAVVVQQAASRLRLSTPSQIVLVGDTLRVRADAEDAHDYPIHPSLLTWTTSDTAVAVVDSTGLIRGIAPGEADVTVTIGEERASAPIQVQTEREVSTVHVTPGQVFLEAIGDTARLTAHAFNRYREEMAGVVFTWTSSDSSMIRVDSTGWIQARKFGQAQVMVTAGTARNWVSIMVEQVPRSITLTAPSTLYIGDSVRIQTTVKDKTGAIMTGQSLTWGSSTPAIARVDSTGLVRAGATGAVQITASLWGRSAPISQTLDLSVLPRPGFEISGISPEPLTPGVTATITGSGFSTVPGENRVTVAGVPVTVVQATASRLTVTLPPFEVFGCKVSRSVLVEVATAGMTTSTLHPFERGRSLPLGIGDYVNLLAPEQLRCHELAPGDGTFLVSVYNTSTTPSAVTSFRISTTSDDDVSLARSAPAGRTQAPAGRAQPPRIAGATGGPRRETKKHYSVLEKNRALLERLGRPRPAAPMGAARVDRALAATLEPPAVGTVLDFRVPNYNADDLCNSFAPVRARVVHAGPRAVVLEDVSAPLAATMDADYALIGSQFESSMFPIIERNFGNPLALDPWLRNTGRVFMLFSPAVNALDGVNGFVTTADFFDPGRCPSSNEANIFYAVVPTAQGSGYGPGTREEWLWGIRATVIHEVKHIASFAERASRNASVLEESWLEEATAMLAEELWARTRYGYGQYGNSTYRQSIYCEVRPTWPECAGTPVVMFDHFAWLYDYMERVNERTPLGPATASDASFYGSGWALLRWAIDHFGTSEAGFLRALTQEVNLSGVKNLEARTGKSFAELLGPWSLSLYMDDYGVTTPAVLSQPSWNLRDIYSGLSADFPSAFPTYWRDYPLSLVGGGQAEPVEVRGGSAAYFYVTTRGRVAMALLGPNGGAPPPSLRIAIVRIQ